MSQSSDKKENDPAELYSLFDKVMNADELGFEFSTYLSDEQSTQFDNLNEQNLTNETGLGICNEESMSKKESSKRYEDDKESSESILRSEDADKTETVDYFKYRDDKSTDTSLFGDADFFIMEVKQIFTDSDTKELINTEVPAKYSEVYNLPIRDNWLEILKKSDDFEIRSSGVPKLLIVKRVI